MTVPVFRKHPAGSPDHQTESAAAHDGPKNLPRPTQETSPAPPLGPACPAALILLSSSTEMTLRDQLTFSPVSSPHQYLQDVYAATDSRQETLI